MIFESFAHSEKFKKDNLKLLSDLSNEVENIADVDYSEVWLNGNSPSFIAGFDKNDIQIVSLPIK